MSDQIIVTKALLNCSKELSFEYFVKPDLLIKWLTIKADVDMKIGGKYELFWTPSDPNPENNSTYGCKVLDVDRPHYFNIEWKGNIDHKGFMNNVRPLTNVTVLFSELSAMKTQVTLIHTGWRRGDNWDIARHYFINAWNGAFIRLESIVNR